MLPGVKAIAECGENGTGRVTDLIVAVIKDVSEVTIEVPGAEFTNKGEGGLTLPTFES